MPIIQLAVPQVKTGFFAASKVHENYFISTVLHIYYNSWNQAFQIHGVCVVPAHSQWSSLASLHGVYGTSPVGNY